MTFEAFWKLLEEPEPADPGEALVRNRALQQGLAVRAIEALEERTGKPVHVDPDDDVTLAYVAGMASAAAEAKWPGFKDAASRLVERERELLCQLEPAC